MDDESIPHGSPQYWDALAATFDDEPDHGLRDPAVRGAWVDRLLSWLPPGRAAILDAGCGTGSLSVLLAALGHEVIGIDWSPAMIVQAQTKAAVSGQPVIFTVMDAANPQFPSRRFDVILCRHVLWALPEPAATLHRWADLLAPGGRLLLIEGYWHTGGGLHAAEIVNALPPGLTNVRVENLNGEPLLWGGVVSDERYAVIADR
ncbi:class I SAM-dependent methyltransferase [Promineifilum sp.]|uniref:class I SAM-dependent methyltransferase n=1 Tax=Promineifilum sp. TaxID=2664178 RepID=UPI0035AE0B4A